MFWIKLVGLLKNRIVQFVVALIIGGVLTWIFLFPKNTVVTIPVTTVDSSWTVVLKGIKTSVKILGDINDKMYPKYDTIFGKNCTLIIKPDVDIGDIPPVERTVRDSFPIYINKKLYTMPFDLSLAYRGIFYSYTVHTIPHPLNINVNIPTDPRLIPYWLIGLSVDPFKDLKAITPKAGVGIVYNKRFDLYGQVRAVQDSTWKFKTEIGIDFIFGKSRR